MHKVSAFIFLSLISLAFSLPNKALQEGVSEKIDSNHFHNLYQVSDGLYRSEQPSKKGMKEVEALGIKSILNLRRHKTNEKKLKDSDLHLDRIPLKAALLNEEDVFTALSLIDRAEKPLLVHCWHGSDRTGAIVAAYRMVFDNWSKERAIAEFTEDRFGYHKSRFPNLITLLKDLNVKALQKKLGQESRSGRE
ncbi:dual specificity protein phosphatase family protein [Zobellia galactanivorans]|uniref:Dual specificity protein phosphatase n=1 Tax=Zobellia galactanivorans (strain DSM 12802 / CCUG 47099 / CIP 106680 / NCIMB 13871 / Dsij) TaxID=63186 RepID=G0L3K1_ZOBGA|nr:dual specificity protein phosphatase family protein [Zobellia galactanivorans]CAZ98473.1 Dual specificity protein phosphatase [Zobellia galactanivorans]